MKISFRIFLGYFLIVGLAAYFILQVFVNQVKPGVRQSMESSLVDTANVLAQLATHDLKNGVIADGEFSRAISSAKTSRYKAGISEYMKEVFNYRIFKILQHLPTQRCQVYRLLVYFILAILDRCQRQHFVDHFGHTGGLGLDVIEKSEAIHFSRIFFQYFRSTANRRQRAFHFVRQGLYVLLDVLFAIQLLAHRIQRITQIAHFIATQIRQHRSLTRRYGFRIFSQFIERASKPEGHRKTDQERHTNQNGTLPDNIFLTLFDEGLDAGIGIGHRQNADQFIAIHNRRGNVHDRAGFIVRITACRSGSVLPAQC